MSTTIIPTTTTIPTTTITVLPTTITTVVTYCKTYRQCGGTAWNGRCSSCGSGVGTGGVCIALVEITLPQQKKHAECPCCECDPNK